MKDSAYRSGRSPDWLEFQVRPGERDAHDGHGEQNRRDEVAERQPPSGENQPHDVADHSERAGADVFAAEIFVVRYGLVAKRQQRVGGDAERGSRPRRTFGDVGSMSGLPESGHGSASSTQSRPSATLRTRMATSPSFVNLQALLKRLSRICLRRMESAVSTPTFSCAATIRPGAQ
jgi:hypothetical protein